MLRHRDHVPGARLGKQRRPGVGIEFFGLEEGDEILITEFLVGAVGFQVVFIFGSALNVHVPGVPFIVEGGHGIHAPVNENAEFGLSIPGGHLELGQGRPIILESSPGDDLVNIPQLGLSVHDIHGCILLSAIRWIRVLFSIIDQMRGNRNGILPETARKDIMNAEICRGRIIRPAGPRTAGTADIMKSAKRRNQRAVMRRKEAYA